LVEFYKREGATPHNGGKRSVCQGAQKRAFARFLLTAALVAAESGAACASKELHFLFCDLG
jgi:hypothetical protein